MTYETLIGISKYSYTINLEDIEHVLEEKYQELQDDESVEAGSQILALIESLKEKKLIGDQDDYHNVAVVCARNNDYPNACFFLNEGLIKYPNSVDLLADYLLYGPQVNGVEDCKEIYNRLMSNKSVWNWRGYQFSIEYLTQKLGVEDVEEHEHTMEMLDKLTSEFINILPYKDEAYTSRAEFLMHSLKGHDGYHEAIRLLESAISEESPVKRAPKCELKLANLYYDKGDVQRANDIIEKCKISSIEVQQSVSRSYVYILSVLCKISLYYIAVGNGNKRYDEHNDSTGKGDSIDIIYNDYHTVASLKSDKRVNTAKEILKSFIRETGKPYPFDDDIDDF